MFGDILNHLFIGKDTEEDIKRLLTLQELEEILQQLKGIPQFYPTNQMVNDYNKYILEKQVSTQ